jgi:hypothetical protein
MFGSFNPIRSLPITIVTAELVVHGTIQTRLQSVTDVVNEPGILHLIVYDATFMEPGSRRAVASASVAQIQLPDVLFLHTSGPTEPGAEVRTAKQAIKATLLAPPYTVEGQIHLPNEAELRQALDAFSDVFVPVTAARYWAYGVAESPNAVDLLVLNRVRAHVAIAAGVEWRGATPDLGGATNPW